MAKRADNLAIMQMALAGYEVEKRRIEEKIREISSVLGGKRIKAGGALDRSTIDRSAMDQFNGRSSSETGLAEPVAKRSLSSAARKRIATAQRKRWDEYRKNKAQIGEA